MGATLQEMAYTYKACVEREFLDLQGNDTPTEEHKKFFLTLKRLMDDEKVAQDEIENVGSIYYDVLTNDIEKAFIGLKEQNVYVKRDSTCYFKLQILIHL